MKVKKVFVEVIAKFDTEGRIIPLTIVWEDGRKFTVDKILDVRQAASLKGGGQGIRYTCRIKSRDTYLYYEGLNWFVEQAVL